VSHFLHFGPFLSLEQIELDTSNLVWNMASTSHRKINLTLRGRGQGHVSHFLNFGPFLSLERIELDTSNLVCKWNMASTSHRKINLTLRGRGQGHVTHFLNFAPPISEKDEDRHFKFNT